MAPALSRVLPWVGGAFGGAALALGAVLLAPPPAPRFVERAPDPALIVAQVREGLRAQGRLPVLTARSVAVVEAKSGSFVFEAQRTLVMPGQMRYLLDLRALGPADTRWDAKTRTLFLVLPPITLAGPQVDLAAVRQFGAGGLLSGRSDADALDAANRLAAQTELIRQAHAPQPMAEARAAARALVRAAFAGPLRAAVPDARIALRFQDEPR